MACCGILLMTGATVGVRAQESPFPLPRPSNTVEYSFSNPGARSLGMGGAFVALADDATAAFSNPSGLVLISEPEVSIEGRYWSYTTPYTAAGRVSGDLIGQPIDTTDGLIRNDSNQDLSGVSFLSFVIPRKNWSLALYRHQSVKFRSTTEVNGLFGGFALGPLTLDRVPDQRTMLELEFVTTAVSGAYKVSDRFFVGAGVSLYDGESLAVADAFTYCNPLVDCLLDQNNILASNAFLPQDQIYRGEFSMDDHDWGFNVGFLWRLPPKWTIGGTYRRGPEFDFDVTTTTGPGLEPIGVGAGTIVPTTTGSGSLRFPSVFGLGAAFSPSDSLRVSFEWDRVEYSSALETTVVVLTGETSQPFHIESLVIDDGDEFRLGVEYTFVNREYPIVSLRLGGWLDPDHRVRHEGDDPFNAAFFQGGDDEMHYAGGIGLKFKRFQMDLGVDLSDPVDTVALSALVQF